MPPPRASVPSYRLHKPTGQAVVTIRTPDGGRKDVYLGKHNSPESRAEYARLIAAPPAERLALPTATHSPAPANVTVAEVALKFLRHATDYYRHPEGGWTSEVYDYRMTARALRELFAHLPAVEFTPRKLTALRDHWTAAGLTRKTVNGRVTKVKRIFKWAAAEELIPAAVPVALGTVTGLARGRSAARETEPIRPVDPADVEATVAHTLPAVAGLVEFQLLTGCRPGEACRVRPCDIDQSGDVWQYKPPHHKNAHRGQARTIAIGPKAQAVLLRFWPAGQVEYVFSPARAVADRNAARSAARKSKRYGRHAERVAAQRKAAPKRQPAARYTHTSYRVAVERGIAKANARPERTPLPPGVHGPVLPPVADWNPNQLRHSRASEVRKLFGLEATQVVLGHSRADVTQVYAERNTGLAVEVARRVG